MLNKHNEKLLANYFDSEFKAFLILGRIAQYAHHYSIIYRDKKNISFSEVIFDQVELDIFECNT